MLWNCFWERSAFLITYNYCFFRATVFSLFLFFLYYKKRSPEGLPIIILQSDALHHTPLSLVSRGKTSWFFCRRKRLSELRKRLGLHWSYSDLWRVQPPPKRSRWIGYVPELRPSWQAWNAALSCACTSGYSWGSRLLLFGACQAASCCSCVAGSYRVLLMRRIHCRYRHSILLLPFAFGNRIAKVDTTPLRRKQRSTIKLLRNKCSCRASSSSHKLKFAGALEVKPMPPLSPKIKIFGDPLCRLRGG